MTKHTPMKLTAHPNVTSLAEVRRERERQRLAALPDDAYRFQMCVPAGGMVLPNFRSASEMLTDSEIEAQSAEEEEQPRRPWWRLWDRWRNR